MGVALNFCKRLYGDLCKWIIKFLYEARKKADASRYWITKEEESLWHKGLLGDMSPDVLRDTIVSFGLPRLQLK